MQRNRNAVKDPVSRGRKRSPVPAATVFAVVIRLTFTVPTELFVKSNVNEFSPSLVFTRQLAFGALVVHAKYTRPLPIESPAVNVLLLPLVAPAFTLIGEGVPKLGALTAAAW
jgi:hypothetical protein